MNIAVVTGFDKPTVPDSKGGIEVWTSQFVLEEAARGNKIDLYAAKGSINTENINLIPILDKSLPYYYEDEYFRSKPEEFTRRKDQFVYAVFAKTLILLKQREQLYDIIINSSSFPIFSYNINFLTKPTITVAHFPVSFALDFYIRTFGLSKNSYIVFPSKFQYEQAEFISKNYKQIIPHGIDISRFNFNPTGSDSMVWMSRVHKAMNKGLIEALAVSSEAKTQLKIHTFIEPSSKQYYKEEVSKYLTDYNNIIQYDIDDEIDKNKILGESKLFIFPLQWDEPFGLVLLEAMSCGTPLVAFARGSIPEIIIDGKTGFIVNFSQDDIRGDWIVKKTGIAGLVEAVEKIYSLPQAEYRQMRRACRELVEHKFTINKMVDQYEDLYMKLLKNNL